jgi:hypothetical protein
MHAAMAWLVDAASRPLELASLALTHRRRRAVTRLHAERLAAEIMEVAESIQIDLVDLPDRSDLMDFSRQTEHCRQQAEAAARTGGNSLAALDEAVGHLHEGHRRIVNLRSELDALLAARRRGKDVPRACKFATGSKPVRSRWASTTSSHTRSTTLD